MGGLRNREQKIKLATPPAIRRRVFRAVGPAGAEAQCVKTMGGGLCYNRTALDAIAREIEAKLKKADKSQAYTDDICAPPRSPGSPTRRPTRVPNARVRSMAA